MFSYGGDSWENRKSPAGYTCCVIERDSDPAFHWNRILSPSFSGVVFSPTKPTHSNNHQNSPEWQHRKCSISRTWFLSEELQHDLWTCKYFMNPAVQLYASQQKRLTGRPSVWKVAWIKDTEEHNFSLRTTISL